MSANLPSESTAVQQKSYVTFTCLPPSSDPDLDHREEPTITILERRHLISGALTTGFRTWEAALHLGSYLLTVKGRKIIDGKNVLELGAGTGLLAILAAKHLNATHVTTTDGDEGVVEALKENLFLNGLDDERKVISSVLRWGQGLRGTWVEEDCEAFSYDVVIGADIVRSLHHVSVVEVPANAKQTYDKVAISALVATLRLLFDMRPELQVVISGAVRNPETFEAFQYACCEYRLFQCRASTRY